ncbi:hypothetical protein NTHI1209_00333 [Haemophilus influenzae]|uniref:Uncharacterized protein n=1 Tax=Haemophilus influenzae TaxID=727 RepID=A0A158SV37_HAEIF|nr:hypothetical protein NTHI1209_00333 [Haemophilus influenzae]
MIAFVIVKKVIIGLEKDFLLSKLSIKITAL